MQLLHARQLGGGQGAFLDLPFTEQHLAQHARQHAIAQGRCEAPTIQLVDEIGDAGLGDIAKVVPEQGLYPFRDACCRALVNTTPRGLEPEVRIIVANRFPQASTNGASLRLPVLRRGTSPQLGSTRQAANIQSLGVLGSGTTSVAESSMLIPRACTSDRR